MAGNKYISNNAGNLTEVAAAQVSAGVADAGKIVALDATGRLDAGMMPVGVAADTSSIVTSENLAAGDFVNIYNNAGVATARKADAATAKPAMGYVLSAVTAPAAALVYFEGSNNQVTGATAGQVFLSATVPGGFSSTAPITAGQIVQKVGFATSATNINCQIEQHVVLA